MDEQIKMFIAGEEVVSNQEFTINEEMLSASSTILNNCYPKSWELTKDYVSNFYYPKDYSKFLLAKGNFQYSNDEFTPLEVTGKNLNFTPYKDGNIKNTNGIKFVVNNDGSVTANGTATSTAYFYYHTHDATPYLDIPKGIYTLSGCSSGGANNKYYVCLRLYNNTTYVTGFYDYGNGTVIDTTNFEYNRVFIFIYINSGIVCDNLTFKVQLEEGSTATSYEPYNENTLQYETNVEKEWNSLQLDGNTYQEIADRNKNLAFITSVSNQLGLTITQISNSEIKISGTANASDEIKIPLYATQLSYTPFTFTAITTGTVSNNIQYIDVNTSVGLSLENVSSNNTYTITSNSEGSIYTATELAISVTSGTVFTNFSIKFQLEKSSTATSYEVAQMNKPTPYTSSELISVGYTNLFKTVNYDYRAHSAWSGYGNYDTTVQDNAIVFPNRYNAAAWQYDNLEYGKTYTFSFIATPSANTTIGIGVNVYLNHTEPNSSSINQNINTDGTLCAFTFVAGVNNRIAINSGTVNNVSTIISNIQLTEGTITHSYIPYGKYGIEIINTGKNLFNFKNLKDGIGNNINYIFDNSTVTLNNTTSSSGNIIAFQTTGITLPAGNYTFSLFNLGGTSSITGSGSDTAIYLRKSDNTSLGAITIRNTTYPAKRNFTLTEATTLYVQIYSNSSGQIFNNFILGFQVESGTITNPTFEHYQSNSQLYILDNPVRSIGNYKDKLYIQNGSLYIERNIGKIILDGSEANWVKSGNTSFDRYILGVNIGGIVSAGGYSNYFTMINANIPSNLYEMSNNGNSQLVFNYATYNTTNLTGFKNWLSNHNVEVNYVLSTPTTEELGAVNLPSSYEGINNVFIDSGIINGRLSLNYYWKNYDVLFAGIVKNSGDISLNPRYPHYCSLQILDYKTFLSESDTLDFVISEKTIAEAIEMVVNSVSDYGFVVGNINISQANDIIGAYSTLNKTAYDVLQYLANISGSRWRARFIDENTMAIDFYDPDLLPQANDIEYTKQYWEDNNIVDLTFNYGTRDYRNKQIVLSDEVYASISYTEVVLSNGYNTNFITQQNVGIVTSVTVNGVEKDVISQKEKELGADADFYYTPGKNVVESANSYTAGTQIAITYIPLVKGRQIVYNDEEVTRIAVQTNTSGVISRYESRNDIVSSQELEQIGETYIEYKGKAELILTLTTEDIDLFNIGEITYFNAPINELQQTYMVKTKKTQYIISGEQRKLFYIYELTSSFNSEKAINYFDNQRNKAQGNIQEGESITRNIDINNSAVIIWDNPTITEVSITITGDNVLNSALNSPFIE